MRYLVYLLTILFVGTAVAQNPTILQGNYITNVFGQANYVKNPNAYIVGSSTTANPSVTGTNATITRSTTTPLVATAKFTITTSTATGYADWDLRTFDQGMKGQNCEARFTYRGFSVGSTTAQILQGSNVVAQVTMTAATDPRIASINFPCGDLSAVTKFRLQQATAALTGTNEIGGIYVGLATNVGSVAQAEQVFIGHLPVGTGTYTLGAGVNTLLFSESIVINDGQYNTATGIFTATKAGYYQFNSNVMTTNVGWTVGQIYYFGVYKNGGVYQRNRYQVQATQTSYQPMDFTSIMYLNVGETAQVYVDRGSGTFDLYIDANYGNLQITRIPATSELVVKPEAQNFFGGVRYYGVPAQANMGSGAAASSTYTTLNSATYTSNRTLQGKCNAPTSSANDIGCSISNMPVGAYQIQVQGNMAVLPTGTGLTTCGFEIYETTTATSVHSAYIFKSNTTGGTMAGQSSLGGIFNNTSLATRNFVIRAAKSLDTSASNAGVCGLQYGNGNAGAMELSAFQIIITPINQPSNSALYVQGPVLGAQTGAAISASYVGEVLSADDGSQQNTTSATYNTLSLALTPGVWDVQGKCSFNRNNATITDANWIGAITNQNANPSDSMVSWLAGSSFVNANAVAIPTEIVRVRWDGTTNITPGSSNTSSNLVYIRCFPSTFTGGPVTVWRKIWARRVN